MVFTTNRVVYPWLGHPIRLKSLRRKTPEVVMVFRASFGNCVCWTKLREKHWSFSVFSSFVHSEKCWICLDRPFTANWKKNKCSKNREKTSTGEEHSSNDFLFSVQIWLTHPLTEVSTDNWKLLKICFKIEYWVVLTERIITINVFFQPEKLQSKFFQIIASKYFARKKNILIS